MDPDPSSTVRRIAALARLELPPAEEPLLAAQFADILEHFRTLEGLDVEGVEPTTGIGGLHDVDRPDEPRPSLAADRVLAAAPQRVDDFYGVPKTVGGEG